MTFKVILKLFFAGLACLYTFFGVIQFFSRLFNSNPASPGGGASISAAFAVVCAGAAIAAALGKSAWGNLQENAARPKREKTTPPPRPASRMYGGAPPVAPEPLPATPSPGMFTFRCPRCEKEYEKEVSVGGQKGRCRDCQHVFTIPLAPPKPIPAPRSLTMTSFAKPSRGENPRAAMGSVARIGVISAGVVTIALLVVFFWPSSDVPIDPITEESRQREASQPPQVAQNMPPPIRPPAAATGPSPSASPPPSPWETPAPPQLPTADPSLTLTKVSQSYANSDDAPWVVLFRGRDPKAWNTRSDGETTAIPLEEAPQNARFLRLKRMDTGEKIIIPLLNGRESLNDNLIAGLDPRSPYRWSGKNEQNWGSHHLGIAEGAVVKGGSPESHGPIFVQLEGFEGYIGSGFGHEGYGDGRTQHFGWRGKKIEPTDFEIAVTSERLQPSS